MIQTIRKSNSVKSCWELWHIMMITIEVLTGKWANWRTRAFLWRTKKPRQQGWVLETEKFYCSDTREIIHFTFVIIDFLYHWRDIQREYSFSLKKPLPKQKTQSPSNKQIIQLIVQMQMKPPLKICTEDSALLLTSAITCQVPASFQIAVPQPVKNTCCFHRC